MICKLLTFLVCSVLVAKTWAEISNSKWHRTALRRSLFWLDICSFLMPWAGIPLNEDRGFRSVSSKAARRSVYTDKSWLLKNWPSKFYDSRGKSDSTPFSVHEPLRILEIKLLQVLNPSLQPYTDPIYYFVSPEREENVFSWGSHIFLFLASLHLLRKVCSHFYDHFANRKFGNFLSNKTLTSNPNIFASLHRRRLYNLSLFHTVSEPRNCELNASDG